MTYVINEPCIATKDSSCVEVCPVRLHPSDPRRAWIRGSRAALHRPGGVHRLRRVRRGVSGRRDHPRGPGPARVAELRREERRLLPTRSEMSAGARPPVGAAEAPLRRRAHGARTMFSVPFASMLNDGDIAYLAKTLNLTTHLHPKLHPSPTSPGVVRLDFDSGLFLVRRANKENGRWRVAPGASRFHRRSMNGISAPPSLRASSIRPWRSRARANLIDLRRPPRTSSTTSGSAW